MRAYVFVDDSNEQVMTLYKAGTGELRAVGFLMRHFTWVPCIHNKHRLAWRGVARRPSRRSQFAFFLTLFPQ